MDSAHLESAVRAATSIAGEHGLAVDEAVVLSNSNRAMVRLLPCDVVARLAPEAYRASAQFEVEIASALADAGCPVAGPDSRVAPVVYVRDGFAVTFWTYHEPLPGEHAPAEYADALTRLHAGMRQVDFAAPRFTARVADAQRIVDDPVESPALDDADRELLSGALRSLRAAILARGAPEQLLHGEPHPGNVLRTKAGLLFIDLETCVRGPVEFDLPYLPEDVRGLYPGVDAALLRQCEVLMLAMVAAWRWDRHDEYPRGLEMGREFLERVRAGLGR